jgi:integrase
MAETMLAENPLSIDDLASLVLSKLMARPQPKPRPTGAVNPFIIDHEGYASIRSVLAEYFEEHSFRRPTVQSHYHETVNHFLSVCKLHDGHMVSTITRGKIKQYKAHLLAGVNGSTVTWNSSSMATVGRRKNPGLVTINQKLRAIEHLVKWCVAHDYMPTNICAGLHLPPRLVAKNRIQKKGFTNVELEKISAALAPYRNAENPTRREWYWLLASLAYGGQRISEVLNRDTADLRQIDGYACWDIHNRGENQHVKNRFSVRLVPVHPNLLAAGLLDWAAQQAGPKLFPLLIGRGVAVVSRWTTQLLRECGLAEKSQTANSFRHTVAQRFAMARVYPTIARRCLGHQSSEDVEGKVYLGGLVHSTKDLAEAVFSLDLPPLT